jgi:rod shape-determining protein MreC
MNRKPLIPFLILFGALLLVLSLSKETSEKGKDFTLGLFKPALVQLNDYKKALTEEQIEIEKLSLQNTLLQQEVSRLQDLYRQEHYLNLELAELQNIHDTSFNDPRKLLNMEMEAVTAKVIYRSPGSWYSSFWINVGRQNNIDDDHPVIAKNSPVIAGGALIGVIDYVGKTQSRVKLITDSGLVPSVRVARGETQNKLLMEYLVGLIENIQKREDLFNLPLDKENTLKTLDHLKNKLNALTRTWYLAKGELYGSSQPLWRSGGNLLRGVGFNYDFPDEHGPARDLRTGKATSASGKHATMPIIKEQDVLVTTGMDGVFPQGLKVAEVTQIELLREGDYDYNLYAKPLVKNLDDITHVFVIPPVGYDPHDQPPLF